MQNTEITKFMVDRLDAFYLTAMREAGLSQDQIDDVKRFVALQQLQDLLAISDGTFPLPS